MQVQSIIVSIAALPIGAWESFHGNFIARIELGPRNIYYLSLVDPKMLRSLFDKAGIDSGSANFEADLAEHGTGTYTLEMTRGARIAIMSAIRAFLRLV